MATLFSIIESWTFSFRYPHDPVTGEANVSMSIDNHLANMSLNEHANVDTSALRGDVTIGDVKRSLKVRARMILPRYSPESRSSLSPRLSYLPAKGWTPFQVRRVLISTVILNAHGVLGRRFATFKLFYYDEAPDNYEPPFFVPADATKDKFTFATHAHTEVPEKVLIPYNQLLPRLSKLLYQVVIGSLDTSFHACA